MPVVATPLSTVISAAQCPSENGNLGGVNCRPTVSLSTCLNQRVVVANTPVDSATGVVVPGRIRTIKFNGGTDKDIQWQMLDSSGNVVDMTECNCMAVELPDVCPYSFKLLLSEYFACSPTVAVDASLPDPDTGLITATLPAAATQLAGMYFAEMVMYDASGGEPVPVFSNHFYIVINRDLLQRNFHTLSGPPTVAEIRLHLRDSGSAESYLLDNFRFSDEEIAACIYLPVQYWNEIPPPVAYFDTNTFPYRYHWLLAITGHLMGIVAEQQRANNLQYSAGGVTVNDQSKEANYTQESVRRLEEYKKFVQRKKIEINMSMCFGSFGSSYR